MAEAHVRSEGAIAEVVDLLTEMRQARGVARRGRFAVLATRAIAALTPEQRRQLAVDVASRAAPQLVERIESESSLDLSPAQVRALVEMVGNLDGADLESLKVAIQDPEFQRQAASRVMAAANKPLGDEVSAEEVAAEEVAAEEVAAEEVAADVAVTGEGPTAPRPLAPVEPPDGPREPPQPQVIPESFAEYTPGLPEMADWRAHGADAAQLTFTPRTRREAPATASVAGSEEPPRERSWFGGVSLGVEPVEVSRTPLGDRLRQVERSRAQLQAFLAAAHEFLELSPSEQASVLRQLRASWVRRRAVLALIEQGRIEKDSAARIVGAFDSRVDRSWIVASLVEAGVGAVADWANLLDPAAAARLERRYAA